MVVFFSRDEAMATAPASPTRSLSAPLAATVMTGEAMRRQPCTFCHTRRPVTYDSTDS